MSLNRRLWICWVGRNPAGKVCDFVIIGLALSELISGLDGFGEGVSASIGSVFSNLGVVGRLFDFGGPEGFSSALRLARSTVSRNGIAASRLVKQYAASPSILLSFRNL